MKNIFMVIGLIALTLCVSSCLASGGNLNSSIDSKIIFDPQPIIEEVE